MAEPDNVVLRHLRAIREQLDIVQHRQLEMIALGNLEVQVANVSVRVDRIDAPLDRGERRLCLIGA